MRIIVFGFRPKTKQVNSSFFSSLFSNYDHLQIEISFTCKIYVVKKYEVHDFEGLNYKLTGERYSFCWLNEFKMVNRVITPAMSRYLL